MNKFEDEDQTMRRHAEAVNGRKRTVDGRGTKATGESTSVARKTPELGSSIQRCMPGNQQNRARSSCLPACLPPLA